MGSDEGSRELVLVCDDEGFLRVLYTRVLNAYEVRSSLRIERLLDLVTAAVTEGRPFWLILDGNIKIYQADDEASRKQIGSQTGEEALARVKALLVSGGHSDLLQAVLFCSGTPSYDEKVLPLGTVDCPVQFLAKAFDASQLREAVQRLMAS